MYSYTLITIRMRIYILIALLGLSANSSAQNISLLDSAYNEGSTEILELFFNKWQAETNDTIVLESDSIKMIYEVFNSFYSPNKLSNYNVKGANFIDNDLKYILVPGEMSYSICSERSPLYRGDLKAKKETILGQLYAQLGSQNLRSIPYFRPKVNIDSSVILFLTPSYRKVILDFLSPEKGKRKTSASTSAKINWLKKVSDIEIKKNMPGAFSREKSDWKILSTPQVEYIFVDPKLNIASIYFTIGDKQIGVAYFEKGEGVWNRTQLIITCADCN